VIFVGQDLEPGQCDDKIIWVTGRAQYQHVCDLEDGHGGTHRSTFLNGKTMEW
jgi:hypothetical protein